MIIDQRSGGYDLARAECVDHRDAPIRRRELCPPDSNCSSDQKNSTIVYCQRGPCTCGDGRRCTCGEGRGRKQPKSIFYYIVKLLIILAVIAIIAAAIYFAWQDGWSDGYLEAAETTDGQPPVLVAPTVAEGGPCRRWSNGYCMEAEDTRSAIQWSRYYLRRGDADSALKSWDSAREFYRHSITLGSGVGGQAAIYAAKRIQFQTMTCDYTDETLSRIARDFDKNPLGGLIEMKQKQQALKAMAYYSGNVDNKHGADTRRAVREFQADLWFDQTGVLTAEQTVLLICAGAQIAKDIASQNVLGVMYAGGLGVRQNTDYALNWLEMAAGRGDADASWNLALLYGTQTVLSSVQICDAVQNAERADSYLKEAALGGHPAAKRAARKYSGDKPEQRWRKLSGDLNRPEALDRVGRGCNPNN